MRRIDLLEELTEELENLDDRADRLWCMFYMLRRQGSTRH